MNPDREMYTGCFLFSSPLPGKRRERKRKEKKEKKQFGREKSKISHFPSLLPPPETIRFRESALKENELASRSFLYYIPQEKETAAPGEIPASAFCGVITAAALFSAERHVDLWRRDTSLSLKKR